MTAPHGYICSYPVYEYKGWTWEMTCSGPWPLKKDGTPRAKAGRVLWKIWKEFTYLTEKEQKARRVGGGCVRF